MSRTVLLWDERARDIEFWFDNLSNSDRHEIYKTKRFLNPDDSLRAASMSVINEAVKSGVEVYENGVRSDDAISIYVSSNTIKDAATAWDNSGFGIPYSLNEDGSIRVLRNYGPLRHDWTLKEISELLSCGYIKGNPGRIIVARPIGLGCSLGELFDWVGFIINGIELTAVAYKVGGITSRTIRDIKSREDRRCRQVARQWRTQGILYPSDLRIFIDTKSTWRLDEVKRRLRLDDELAIKLLDALGLEPKGNEWHITHSTKSIKHRKQWLRNEKKYLKKRAVAE